MVPPRPPDRTRAPDAGRARGPRLELAWTAEDRSAVWGRAVAAAPREGAVIALCTKSTGASRTTFIVHHPIAPSTGDLDYRRGRVVTVTARYLNRAIDALHDGPRGVGIAILHTHPGHGVPVWSSDDDRADRDLAAFLYGEDFLAPGAPLVMLVASHDALRARAVAPGPVRGRARVALVGRMRTLSLPLWEFAHLPDHSDYGRLRNVPKAADRSIRVLGKQGQRLLASLHVAVVGVGGVGSIVADHLARYGIGRISLWDPDVVKDVNINRSGVYTYSDVGSSKADVLGRALTGATLVRDAVVTSHPKDVRLSSEVADLLNADLIVMLVDDARPRNFINRIAFAHYIPVIEAGSAITSTGANDGEAEASKIEEGGLRVSTLVPGGPCLWCAGHLNPRKLSLAYRSPADIAADRTRGYVEGLGPENAPSVMPVNSLLAGLLEVRLQDVLFGLSGRSVPEAYFGLVGGGLDELPRVRLPACSHCQRWEATGDLAELPFGDI